MKTMSFMTFNKKPDALSRLITGLCALLAFMPVLAQPSADLAAYKAKYPGEQAISLLEKRDITIEQDKKGAPVIRIKDSGIEMILAESASLFTESKEYLNAKTELKKLEAYSLIPDQDKYRKVAVTKFTKTTEDESGLYFDDNFCYSFNFPAPGKGGKRCKNMELTIKDPCYPLTFFFDRGIPVEKAELTITFPESIKINYRLFGEDTTRIQFSKSRKGDQTTYRWVSHLPKGYEHDQMAPGIRYYVPHLIAHISESTSNGETSRYISTLNDLYKWEYKNISQVNKTENSEIKHLADSLTKGISSPKEKIRSIYKWVQNNIKYIAIEDGKNGLVPREAALVLNRRYGDCKDKSSLLTAMIRAIGQPSSLAWLGTRELPYKYTEFPTISAGNHMIAVWWDENKQPVILDGTSRHLMMEDIPAFIQGKECIIEKGENDYMVYPIPVADPVKNTICDTIWMSVENGQLVGKGVSVFLGERKAEIISLFERKEKDKYATLWTELFAKASDKFNITAVNTSDLNNADQPFRINYEFQLPDYITNGNNTTYVNMNIERGYNNINISKERIIPIEAKFQMEHRLVCILKIPEYMQTADLPDPASFNNSRFGFSQTYKRDNNQIILSTNLHLNFLMIRGEEILQFNEMIAALKRAYRNTIVLNKI